ncbi:MAG TPA: hypothetical protein VKB18_00450 [Gemmatimonadota bacterium]|nr:hypothetical protein [Gemmatimonadota bacterium]
MSGEGDFSRLGDRLRDFVDLAGRVESACESMADRAGGGRAERCRDVARRARQLGEESRELAERLEGLEGRSKLRVLIGLVLSRGRQRKVADLAREVAGAFHEVSREAEGRHESPTDEAAGGTGPPAGRTTTGGSG